MKVIWFRKHVDFLLLQTIFSFDIFIDINKPVNNHLDQTRHSILNVAAGSLAILPTK